MVGGVDHATFYGLYRALARAARPAGPCGYTAEDIAGRVALHSALEAHLPAIVDALRDAFLRQLAPARGVEPHGNVLAFDPGRHRKGGRRP